MKPLQAFILFGLFSCGWEMSWSQCVPMQPQNLQATVNANNSVTVRWNVTCPSTCNNAANTSVVYYIGFYSQQSAAPNGLSGEYDFTTYVAPGCFNTELWDGFYRDSASAADPKRSECFGIVAFQRDVIFFQVVTRSFSVQEICNGNYGYGPGVMEWNFDKSYFCSGVTYDVMVWEIEVNVAPNALLTSADIACNNLYLGESNPAVITSAFTYPGFIAPIAAPTITISGSSISNGVYSGQNNPVVLYCSDIFDFDYAVTPGCNFTESVAGYYQINSNFTFGTGVNYPGDIGLGVEDWFIFFANNIVDGNTGNPIPYIERDSIFHGFSVDDSTEVCILAQDPCNGSSSVTCIQFVIIDPDPVLPNFSYTITPVNNCDSFLVNFTNNTTGGNYYLWDFGDGFVSTSVTPSHVFVGTGPFDVVMTASDTTVCNDVDTLAETISFSAVPDTVHLNYNYSYNYTQNCDSLVANFSVTGTGVGAYHWDFGNGVTSASPNNTVVYTDTGDYNVVLIVTGQNACTTGDTVYETVSFHPVFADSTMDFGYDISYTNNCDTFIIAFTDSSNGVNTYYWDFGNGSFSNDSAANITYTGPGTFQVMLAASFYGQCVNDDTVFKTITLTADSIDALAGFTSQYIPVNYCDSLLVQFNSTSTNATSLFWDFGNGITSSDSSNLVLYTDTGVYTVTLYATGLNACSRNDTISQIVSFYPIYADSSLNFGYDVSYTNNCDTFILTFIDSSNGVNSYYWDFGNGEFSTSPSPNITYTSSGTIQVMLTANFNGLCVNDDTVFKTITLVPDSIPTVADFSFQTIPVNSCDSLQVEFTNNSTDAYSLFWDFGNGITSTDSDVTVLYTDTGSYVVTLYATGLNTCSLNDTLTQTVVFSPIINRAVAAFQTNVLQDNGCDRFQVEFINQSNGGTSYFWDAGNGITSVDTNLLVDYNDTGSYTIMLAVGDNRMCSVGDTAFDQIYFQLHYSEPFAAFNWKADPGCDQVELTFQNTSSPGFNYLWKVNDAVVGNTFSPNSSLFYSAPETLMVSLEVLDTLGTACSRNDTFSKLIVTPAPFGYTMADFNFSPNDPVTFEDVLFNNASINADPDLYHWDFGDGNTSSETDPVHFYEYPGEYEICLTAENNPACPVPACKKLEIKESEVIGVPTAFTPNGDHNNDIFIVRGRDIETLDLKIFNRWGELVFESMDPNVGWDGSYKGEPQEMDVYVYLLNATIKNRGDFFRKGNVTLLR